MSAQALFESMLPLASKVRHTAGQDGSHNPYAQMKAIAQYVTAGALLRDIMLLQSKQDVAG